VFSVTELDQLIAAAFASEGKQEDVNKVYLALLRASLYVPVQKKEADAVAVNDEAEPFQPLFAKVDDKFFMLVFDTLERLTAWAGDEFSAMEYVELSGRDVLSGIGDVVFLGLNLGSVWYKEFSPDEIKRLKMVVSRIAKMQGG
jgi:hypothetical protein